ncbi:hypothetical protein Bbelb_180520 [Branchiostoma belcheri]|nr:hypothetical protein Bbelb_180520 [Branchiostoma belcheri]
MKFLVCLMFFLVTAGFASGQSVQGVRPPGLPGRDGRDGRDCPCGTKDTQISELQSKYQELRDQNEDLEQRLSVLEGNTTHQSGSAGTQISELQSKHQELRDQTSGLRQQNEDLEQRLSVLEDRIGNTTQSDSAGYPPSSCTEVAERSGIHNQTFYVIDPDGPGRGVLPMVVQCDLQGETPITLIGHDSEARTHVKGFEGAGSYSKDVTYWNSMEQVRAVVNQSSSCKQHIQYECFNSHLWDNRLYHKWYSWWVTWDGRKADYWGGASPESGKCACGETGKCPGYKCNCDANDLRWREDFGFLTHKDDLPVSQLRFGDTKGYKGRKEEGYHTLGKLICYP